MKVNVFKRFALIFCAFAMLLLSTFAFFGNQKKVLAEEDYDNQFATKIVGSTVSNNLDILYSFSVNVNADTIDTGKYYLTYTDYLYDGSTISSYFYNVVITKTYYTNASHTSTNTDTINMSYTAVMSIPFNFDYNTISVRVRLYNSYNEVFLEFLHPELYSFYFSNFDIFSTSSNSNQNMNTYSFYNFDGCGLSVSLHYLNSAFVLIDNILYTNPTLDGSSAEDIYNIGKNDGIEEGFDLGIISTEAREYWKNYWFGRGYDSGLQDGSDYTFFSLISSVIDAPITAVSGLLNFDILGINLYSFFLSMLTLALVIALIRLVL